MTKAEQLAKKEYPIPVAETLNISSQVLNMSNRIALIKGYSLRDQTAQSDMVKFAEWLEVQKRERYIHYLPDNIRKEWRIMPHAPYYTTKDFITTTDLLKIFNELNKGE